jgi:hypothetical protein
LFSLLRQHHPRLLSQTPGDRPVQQALRGLARVVDALNPARNESSLAHPNENLLEDPEAMLLINAIRTLLHYLDTKIR